MDRDKAIEKMAIHLEFMSRKLFNMPTCRQIADQMLSIIADETELSALRRDAAKWRKVEEIAKYAKKDCVDGSDGCPAYNWRKCFCVEAEMVVNALSEVPDGK